MDDKQPLSPSVKHTVKSGFTLIEMSIVLVIIGLIAGGILVGQDLINAATIRAQITQIGKYNTAVRTFQNKYGGLPGDLSLNTASMLGFNVSSSNGTLGFRDGNGLIDGYWSGTYGIQGWGEAVLFWQDLSYAKLIDGTFPNSGATSGAVSTAPWTLTQGTTYIGDYFPLAKIGQGNFLYIYEGQNAWYNLGGTWYPLGGDNWYGLSAMTNVFANGVMDSNPALSVLQAYNIDKKMDDGMPTTGSVQAVYSNNSIAVYANPQASDSATSCYNTATNTYSTGINGGNGLNCALSFKFQ